MPQALGGVSDPRPFRCTPMPMRRGQGVASFLVMMGQQRSGFVQAPRVRLFERAGRRWMDSLTPLPELRVQRHLPASADA